MNQYCKYIVLAPHDMHVVKKLCRVNIHMLSSQHTDNVILQTFEIHLDVSDN